MDTLQRFPAAFEPQNLGVFQNHIQAVCQCHVPAGFEPVNFVFFTNTSCVSQRHLSLRTWVIFLQTHCSIFQQCLKRQSWVFLTTHPGHLPVAFPSSISQWQMRHQTWTFFTYTFQYFPAAPEPQNLDVFPNTLQQFPAAF